MDKVIRILLVVPFFYPHRGGSQKYAEELLATTVKLYPNTIVDVLCYNTDNVISLEKYRGLTIYRVPCFTLIPARFVLPNPISLIEILVKLSNNKYQYVNTHIRFFDPTWWLWIYAKLIGAKSILTEHVAMHPVHQNKVIELIAKLVDISIAKYSSRMFDYVTFTNKTAQKFITETFKLKSPTYLFYGGIDTDYFKPGAKKSERTLPKIAYKISKDTTVITFVGRLIWTKGVTYYYEAIKAYLSNKNNSKDVLFVIAGPGELEQQLKTQITNDKLTEKVIMTGDMSYENVRDLLSITDIFINPSHHNEGFPNTILEAGSSEAFVIATDNAGTNEVVNKDTGILIPQKDAKAIQKAIEWAISNRDQTTKISHNFREILVKKFDWKAISKNFYEFLYKNC